MEIKGTAVKSIQEFVKRNYAEKYDLWITNLPEESKKIMTDNIYATNWYPLKDAAIETTRAIGKMFYQNDIVKAAKESGRESANQGLSGVYKIFVKIASPSYIIKRASRVFASYYNPSEIVVADTHDKGVTIHITKFPQPDSVIENRIAGWIERAFEITNCKNVQSKITKSLTKGDDYTAIETTWD